MIVHDTFVSNWHNFGCL